MNGNIYINGVIGTFLDEAGEVLEKGVELIDVIMQVRNQPQATSYTMYIDSPGGYVHTGYEIYDYLKGLNKPINTVGQGIVGSMGTVLFMLGQKRTLKPNTDFFIHLPQGGIDGSSHDIDLYAKDMKETEKKLVKLYEEGTGLTAEAITPLLVKETMLTTDEAFKLGFTTERTQQQNIVAIYDKPQLKKEKMNKPKKSILAQIGDILIGAKITNKIVFDAEQNELDFYELADNEAVKVGDKANYDGTSADGEYKVPSDEDPNTVLTYVFTGGELTEIKEPEAEAEPEAEPEANAEDEVNVEELLNQIEALELEKTELTNKLDTVKEENKNYKLAINKIKMLQGQAPKDEKRDKPQENKQVKVNPLSEAINNVKNKKK